MNYTHNIQKIIALLESEDEANQLLGLELINSLTLQTQVSNYFNRLYPIKEGVNNLEALSKIELNKDDVLWNAPPFNNRTETTNRILKELKKYQIALHSVIIRVLGSLFSVLEGKIEQCSIKLYNQETPQILFQATMSLTDAGRIIQQICQINTMTVADREQITKQMYSEEYKSIFIWCIISEHCNIPFTFQIIFNENPRVQFSILFNLK